MADPLSADEGEDRTGAKENFIGRVLFSRKSCDCETCEKGRQNANFERDDDRDVYDHPLHVEPLEEYDNEQDLLSLSINDNFQSKWMLFIGHLQQIHGNLNEHVDSIDELGEFLEGKVYEFRDITFTEDEEFTYPGDVKTVTFNRMFTGDNPPNSMLVPVRAITDEDELADLGEESAPEADETVEL